MQLGGEPLNHDSAHYSSQLVGTTFPMLVIWMSVLLMSDSWNNRLIGGIFCLKERGFVSLNNELASQAETWEQTSLYSPTLGNLDRYTPSVYCTSPSRLNAERSSSLPRPARLGYYDEASNGNLQSCDDHTQTYINNRGVARDTEEDLVLKPSSY